MPRRKDNILEEIFSVRLPYDLIGRLRREADRRGNMPISTLIRMMISEWFATNDRRVRKKKKQEEPPPPQ